MTSQPPSFLQLSECSRYVEYAGKAVENSGTSITIRGKDSVVFAVEKIVTSKLYEKGANRRIFNITSGLPRPAWSTTLGSLPTS